MPPERPRAVCTKAASMPVRQFTANHSITTFYGSWQTGGHDDLCPTDTSSLIVYRVTTTRITVRDGSAKSLRNALARDEAVRGGVIDGDVPSPVPPAELLHRDSLLFSGDDGLDEV